MAFAWFRYNDFGDPALPISYILIPGSEDPDYSPNCPGVLQLCAIRAYNLNGQPDIDDNVLMDMVRALNGLIDIPGSVLLKSL